MSKQENEAKSMGKVTDYAEENVVNTSTAKLAPVNVEPVQEVVTIILKQDDINLIMRELDYPRDLAEGLLRKYKGNAENALRDFINGK